MTPLLQVMIDAALEAGAEIERLYGAGCATEWKPDGSPVTEADRAAEAIILRQLRAAYPDVPVLAEEAVCAGKIPEFGGRFFLVDPLDGTRGFVERNGEFTVNIALIENLRPIVGVVYAPDTHALYAGERGCGTVRSLAGGAFEHIQVRPVPGAGLSVIASRSGSRDTLGRIAHLPVADFAPSSSSLKFCLIAEGSADAYPRFGRTMEWDTGAGQALLEAAGGHVLALDEAGKEIGPLLYGKVRAGFANPGFIAWGSQLPSASA